jgi:hypothetical protein
MAWDSFPAGFRAPVGKAKSLSTGDSSRLKLEFDFTQQHLKEWLEEIQKDHEYIPDPNDPEKTQAQKKKEWDERKNERVAGAIQTTLARYHAAHGVMTAVRASLKDQIKALEQAAKDNSASPGDQGRLEKLKKLLAKMPSFLFKTAKSRENERDA